MSLTSLSITSGAMNGLLILGALQRMHEKGYLKNLKNFAGTSIGSVIAGLMSIGFTPYEIFSEYCRIDDAISNIDLISLLTCKSQSLIKVEKFENSLRRVICAKYSSIPTFEDVKNIGFNLFIGVLNLNTGEKEYLNAANSPNLPILDAIIASCSIPILFPPKNINSTLYCDLGVIESLPLKPLLEIVPRSEIIAICFERSKWSSNSLMSQFLFFTTYATEYYNDCYINEQAPSLGITIKLPRSFVNLELHVKELKQKWAAFLIGYNHIDEHNY